MKTRTDLALATLLAFLTAVPVLTSGCTEEQKEKMAIAAENRRRGEAQRVLKERALEYWEAVRWNNWSQAAIYLQEADDQKRFLQMKTDPDAVHVAMDDVQVAYVFVDPKTFETGEVRVQWNEVAPKEGRVADEQYTQQWYKDSGRWWLDPEATLLEATTVAPDATTSGATSDATSDTTSEAADQ